MWPFKRKNIKQFVPSGYVRIHESTLSRIEKRLRHASKQGHQCDATILCMSLADRLRTILTKIDEASKLNDQR